MVDMTTWLSLGAVGMALGTLVLAYGFRIVPQSDRRRYAIIVAVPFIAFFAYLFMALGFGEIETQTSDSVLFLRYLDWLLTTPLHILYLGMFAGAARGVITRAVSLQALTIVFGMAAAIVGSPLKWLLYAGGVLAFAGVVYYAYSDFATAAAEKGGSTDALYRKLRAFLIVLWLVYPLIWLAGQNAFGLMDVETTALVVAYIDVVSKVGLGLIALNGHLAYAGVEDRTASPADD